MACQVIDWVIQADDDAVFDCVGRSASVAMEPVELDDIRILAGRHQQVELVLLLRQGRVLKVQLNAGALLEVD